MNSTQNKLAKPVVVGRGPSGRIYLTLRGATSERNLPFLVRWSFLLFIASIGCEVSSLTALFGVLFFAIYFLYHNPLSRERSFPPVPRVMIWFVIYLAIYALHGFFLPDEPLREFFARLVTLVQLIVFLWIASDIMKDETMAKKALIAFSTAALILSIGVVLSLPGFGVTAEVGIERASVERLNANVLAYVTALAVVALLGLWLKLPRKRVVESAWMFGSMVVLSLATVYTGSRGGVVMLMVGLSVYVFPYWKNRWRISAVVVALVAMACLAYVAAKTPAFYERWLAYTEEGDSAGRDRINEEALQMISERPLVGWGPAEYRYELGSRTGTLLKDAHSIFLHLLMEGGLIGAVPFLIGLWFCGTGAWRARNGNAGLLPLALLIASLVGGMASTSIYFKAQWLALAVAVAAIAERKRAGMVLVGRRIENGIPVTRSSNTG